MDHEKALGSIVAWAKEDENVRAAVLVGSVARGLEHVDELSDVDVELYVEDPSVLLADDSWHSRFGQILVVEALTNPGWHPTRLLYYAGGKIDVMVAPVDALGSTSYTVPFRVLMDKDGLTASLVSAEAAAVVVPDRGTFLECLHWFYAATLMSARNIARNEPWLVKRRDWDLKQELLRMIEWDHKARYGWDYDTGYDGRYLDKWVDADVRTVLEDCWAPFSVEESAHALMACMDLFERLSGRTATALGIDLFDASRVRQEVLVILAKRSSVQ